MKVRWPVAASVALHVGLAALLLALPAPAPRTAPPGLVIARAVHLPRPALDAVHLPRPALDAVHLPRPALDAVPAPMDRAERAGRSDREDPADRPGRAAPRPAQDNSRPRATPPGDERPPGARPAPSAANRGAGPAVDAALEPGGGSSGAPAESEGTVLAPRAARVEPLELGIPLLAPELGAEERARITRAEPKPGTKGGLARGYDLRPSGDGSSTFTDPEFRAKVLADGTVELEDRIEGPDVGMDREGRPRVSVPFDVTDTLLRLAGEDPYAYEKRRFMSATRAAREQLADAACTERLRASVAGIRAHLEAIWRSERSAGEKRRIIFQLWDECAEDGSEELLAASASIRASILSFIAEKLPEGSPYAFPGSELSALNERRHSRAVFAPYAR